MRKRHVPAVHTSESPATPLHPASMKFRFRKIYWQSRWTWIIVVLVCLVAGILTFWSSFRMNSNNVIYQGLDSNFYANLVNLLLSTTQLVIIALHTTLWTATKFWMVVAFVTGVVCVATYPVSPGISLWAGFACQLAQCFSTTHLIENQKLNQEGEEKVSVV